jgi:hypothetical protein
MNDSDRDELLRAAVAALNALVTVQVRRARLDADEARHAGRIRPEHLTRFYVEMDALEAGLLKREVRGSEDVR